MHLALSVELVVAPLTLVALALSKLFADLFWNAGPAPVEVLVDQALHERGQLLAMVRQAQTGLLLKLLGDEAKALNVL